ncbi:hypothetical protein [Amaricoccus macauensis]|uniref:hypothetical protein n=1 Tax=Amaricoccus macauensis TaxID=57001 RepID=UPI003C7D54A9
MRVNKKYFDLEEVSERWGVRIRDLGYLAENDELKVSTRLEDAHLEHGSLEVDNDQDVRIPHERSWYTGIIDLKRRDAFRIFRYGAADVGQFEARDTEYTVAIDPTPSVKVRIDHLVVRRDERDRLEAAHDNACQIVGDSIRFQHAPDYRTVRLGATELSLGPVQADVVRLLHKAALTDQPWCDGKTLLSKAGAASFRMSDVFKSQARWRDLIQSDGRGRYRLRLTLD